MKTRVSLTIHFSIYICFYYPHRFKLHKRIFSDNFKALVLFSKILIFSTIGIGIVHQFYRQIKLAMHFFLSNSIVSLNHLYLILFYKCSNGIISNISFEDFVAFLTKLPWIRSSYESNQYKILSEISFNHL